MLFNYSNYKNIDLEKIDNKNKFTKNITCRNEDYIDYEYYENEEYGYCDNEEISILKWVIILILCAIPIVNIIAVICFVFSKNGTLKNFGKAQLILLSIALILIMIRSCVA